MAQVIIEWDNIPSVNSEMQIIDIYTTNLLEIPLDELDLVEFAYYDALGKLISDQRECSSTTRCR